MDFNKADRRILALKLVQQDWITVPEDKSFDTSEMIINCPIVESTYIVSN